MGVKEGATLPSNSLCMCTYLVYRDNKIFLAIPFITSQRTSYKEIHRSELNYKRSS